MILKIYTYFKCTPINKLTFKIVKKKDHFYKSINSTFILIDNSNILNKPII